MKREKKDRFLADKSRRIETENRRDRYERLLIYIANLEFPGERGRQLSSEEEHTFWSTGQLPRPEVITDSEQTSFLRRLRSATEGAWPEIWIPDPRQPTADVAVRRVRTYLRRCWDARNQHERLWHIYRAIEYCQTLHILRDREVDALDRTITKAIQEGDAQQLHGLYLRRQMRTDDLLDKVPQTSADSFLKDALFHLYEMAEKASRKPMHCDPPGTTCERPYFFRSGKGNQYCKLHRGGTTEGKRRKNRDQLRAWHERKHIYRPKKGDTNE
jgi:hypothetical protein